MRIELTPELGRALTEAARKRGITPEALALEYLRERFVGPTPSFPGGKEPANLGEFLEGFIGVLDSGEFVSGPSDLSEDTGRRFTEVLLKRRQEGRL